MGLIEIYFSILVFRDGIFLSLVITSLLSRSAWKLAKIGVTVIAAFAAIWAPIAISAMPQVLPMTNCLPFFTKLR